MTTESKLIGFSGIWTDVLIPISEDLSIDEAKLAAHVRNLSANGLDQLVLFGQAGEGASFSMDEKLSATGHLIAAGVNSKDVLIGVHSNSFSENAEFIRRGYSLGIRRFLLKPPLSNQSFSHIALFNYFNELIKQVSLTDWQLFIHQLGGNNHSGDLPEATLAELRKVHPHIFSGIVDQDTHVNHTVDLIRSFGAEISIASTNETNLSILKPKVCVSALANVIPSTIKHVFANDVVDSAATKISGMKVAKPDDRIVELVKVLSDYPTIASLKLFLSMHYRLDVWGRVRPPQSGLSKEAKEKLMAAFKTFNLQAHE